MTERMISRRDFNTGVLLLGTAAFLEACGVVKPSNNPSTKPGKTPDTFPSATIFESPSVNPAFSPYPETTSTPTIEPTLKPAPEDIERITAQEIVWHGDLKKPYVYLTMDDCYKPDNVEKALNAANKAGIKMTFLPVGKVIHLNPGLYKDIIASGHAIENHTFSHSRLDTHSKTQIKTEILKARDALWNAVGEETPQTFVRPRGGFGVFGYGNSAYQPLLDAASELDYKILMWDITSAGTSKYATTASVEKRVGKGMHKGGISLQHALNVDVSAFPQIIETILQRGFKPITIPQGMR